MDERLAFLRRVPLFSEFDENDFQELERLAQLGTVTRGGYVFVPGDPSEHVFLLRSGRAKISKSTPEGKEWILTLVEPGDIFGETALAGEPAAPRPNVVPFCVKPLESIPEPHLFRCHET